MHFQIHNLRLFDGIKYILQRTFELFQHRIQTTQGDGLFAPFQPEDRGRWQSHVFAELGEGRFPTSSLNIRPRSCLEKWTNGLIVSTILHMDGEDPINYQVCKHEASHLLIAHLFQGDGAITRLQLPGHPELPAELRANCVMGDWFSKVNCCHTSIPTLMAGIIADQLAGTPFAYCREDLGAIAECSLYCVDAHIGYFAKIVHRVLSSSEGGDVVETVADQIELAYKDGVDSIGGAILHKNFTKLLGRKFKCDKPDPNKMQYRLAPKTSKWELEQFVARRIYSEILNAVPSIEIPGFR